MTRRGQKKVADWKIEVRDVGLTADVGVWMIVDDKGHENATRFEARYEPAQLRLANTDINDLRKDVEKELARWATVKWDLYLYVCVGGGYVHEHGQDISFAYDWVALGKRTDGTELWTKCSEPDCGPFCEREVRDGQKPKHEHARVNREKGLWNGIWDGDSHRGDKPQEGRPPIGKKKEFHGEEEMHALVPATPEAFAAIIRFVTAIDKLREQVQLRFAPKLIDGTLRDLLIPALGPAPDGHAQ